MNKVNTTRAGEEGGVEHEEETGRLGLWYGGRKGRRRELKRGREERSLLHGERGGEEEKGFV